MTTLQKAFETCQADKSAWLQRRAELAQTEQAYREQLAADNRNGQRLQMLRDIIDVKKWEINQAAGRYIRSHEEVQRISICNRLNDFMQARGAGRRPCPRADELFRPASRRSALRHAAFTRLSA